MKLTSKRSWWPLGKILRIIGLRKSTWHAWVERERLGLLEDRKGGSLNLDQLLPEEEDAIADYALSHPREGYQRLAYMMIDDDVAYCSPSSVYNVLSRRELLCRWKVSRSCGQPVEKPEAPNQRWHTDIMYLWLAGRWYFFVGVLDGYSRYLVHWELLSSMRADDVTLVVQRALEKAPGCTPEVVSDNGSQFTSRDFRALVKRFQLRQIKIRVHHPESNGQIERLHRSLREGLSEKDLRDLSHARQIIGEWVEYYNCERLHAGILYLRPSDYYFGRKDEVLGRRISKLGTARSRRREANRQRYLSADNGGQNHTNLGLAESPVFA